MRNEEPRIVSIIPYQVLPARLGGEKGIASFNEHLAELVDLTAIATRNNDPVLAKGYRLLNILSNSRLRYINIFLFFRVRQILKKIGASHLLIEHPYYGWLAWMLRSTLRIRWVVHSHNIEYMRSRSIGRWWWRALKWYEGWVYRKADRVFFISEDDREHAIAVFHTDPLRSQAVTFGTELSALPGDITGSREKIQALYGIRQEEKILLFNGALYHSTNYDALRVILEEINPHLLASGFRYRILVCGKGLPDFFNELKDYSEKNIIYAGFVDDIPVYFKAADIFLNPILTGGGVKTKAIEAMAMNCTVISTELGAMGLNRAVCGNKLYVTPAGEWEKFARLIMSCPAGENTPAEFFAYYSWKNIVARAVSFI